MNTIVVTGAAGFIGSHLCEALLARGDRVVGIDNFDGFYDPAVKRENISPCMANDNFTLADGDIRDGRFVSEALGGDTDAIVHLAARAGVRPSIQEPLVYQDVNVGGTSVMLEMARGRGVRRFIFASSSSVYGNRRKVPFSEADNVDEPISPYAATKKAGELIAHTYFHLHGMSISCLRLFTVYGPRQRPDLAIHKFTKLIDAGQPVPVFGDGQSMRDYTAVEDIVDGILRAMDRSSGYRIYNLGESRPIRLMELIGLIEAALGRRATIERQPEQPGDVVCTYADITRAREELGYNPTVDLEVGIRRFVEWFRRRAARPQA